MPLTVGGGVRTVEDIRRLLLAGADKVSINTAAVPIRTSCARRRRNSAASASSSPSTPRRCRRRAIRTAGRSSPTAAARRPASTPSRSPVEVAGLGAGELLVTSMDRDGTKVGYDLALVRAIADAVSVPVIASGGVGTLDHLVDGIRDGHASAVLAASIFHFGDAHHRRGEGSHGRRRACRCGWTARACPGRRMTAFTLDDLARIVAERAAAPPTNPIRPSCSPRARRKPPRSSARRRSRR